MQVRDLTLAAIKKIAANKRATQTNETPSAVEERFATKRVQTVYEEQSGLMDLAYYNETASQMEEDLAIAYQYINTLSTSLSSHQEMKVAYSDTLLSLIEQAEKELDAYERSFNADANVSFYNVDLTQETDRTPTGRFGESLSAAQRCKAESADSALMLSYNSKLNAANYGDGVMAGRVALNYQLGGAHSRGTAVGKQTSRMIDTSLQTYWTDTLFTDQPIRIAFATARPIEASELDSYYYGVQHGALFELEFTFETASNINELDLMPYAEFPIDLIAVRYRHTDDTSEPLKEVVYPEHLNPALRGGSLQTRTKIQFEEITCKRLYIVCNQIHYTKENLLVDGAEQFKNMLWSQLTTASADTPSLEDDLLFKPLYLDYQKTETEAQVLEALLQKTDAQTLKNIAFGGGGHVRPVVKYKYQYGFHNIAPNRIAFEPNGCFITSQETDGNIKQVSIEVSETLPGIADKPQTDVEYYVTASLTDQEETWIPILPVGKTHIPCERLLLHGSYCPLRFEALIVEGVYRNQFLLSPESYTLIKSQDERVIGILIPGYNTQDVYTVSYVPDTKAHVLSFLDDLKPELFNSIEMKTGDGTSYYELEGYPYLIHGDVATEVKLIHRQSGTVLAQSDDSVRCVTNATAPEESYRDFSLETEAVQYYVCDNVLYFDQTISHEYDIEINYKHAASCIYLKALLRCNANENKWLTPKISKIQLNVETI